MRSAPRLLLVKLVGLEGRFFLLVLRENFLILCKETRIKKALFLSARRNLTQWELNHPDTMNACRRIHSLRAHRQKTNGNKSENWYSTSGFKHQHGDDLVTVHTLYTVILMILLVALWGAWSRKDSSL